MANDDLTVPEATNQPIPLELEDNSASQAAKPTSADLDRQAADSIMHTQGSQIRANLLATQGQNPDQAAQYQHLAKFTSVPIESVYADPEGVRQQAAMQNLDTGKLVTQYPHLTQFLGNQYNVAKSSDDIPTLAGVEDAAKALPQPQGANAAPDFGENPAPRASGFMDWLASLNNPDIQDEPSQAGETFLQGVGTSVAKMGRAVNLMMGIFPSAYDKAASLIKGQETTGASEAYNRMFLSPMEQHIQAMSLPPDASILDKTLHGAGQLVGTLATIAATAGASEAPALAEGATTALQGTVGAVQSSARLMAVPAVTEAINTGHDVYAKTGSLTDAVKAATAAYSTTVGMGLVPLSLPGGMATRVITGFPIGGVTGEVNRQIMNLSMPSGMQTPFNLSDLLVSSITGSLLAGTMGGAHAPVTDALSDAYSEGLKAAQSGALMGHLQNLDQMAAQSKLRERDADSFKAFVSTMAEDGHAPDLYIDAPTLNEVLAQTKIPFKDLQEKMPDVAAQLNAGMTTNGVVRIPLEDYATSIAGTPLAEQLMPHLKTDPDGMTYTEGQAYAQKQQETMTEQTRKLAQDQEAFDLHQQQLQTINSDIRDQLNATGKYPDAVSKQYAAMHEAIYDTLANRLDMSPESVYQRFPLKVQAGSLADGVLGAYHPESGVIHLGPDTNLSTFLHESGHFYLDVMHSIATSDGVPPGMHNDFDTLLQSFKIAGATADERISNWNRMDIAAKRDSHEQWAEGFEHYLMTGKAPTAQLQGMFGRFRSWLMQVYKNLVNIGQPLSPEVKSVMDRLFATDDAIRAAEKTQMFVEAADMSAHGTPEQIAEYFNLHDQAHRDALAEMQARSMRDMKWLDNAKSRAIKALQKEANGARKAIRDQVTKEVEAEPVYKAERFLRRGEMDKPLNETNAQRKQRESTLGYKSKMDIDALKEMYGDNPAAPWRYLDTGTHGLVAKDGLHPDLVADMFGFNSGRDLVSQLLGAPKIKDKIDGITDQRMLEEHGDLVDPVSIQEAARAATHNEARAKMMATGLKILSKSPVSSTELNRQAKAAADTAIAAAKIGELRPAKYSAAEAKSNKALLRLAPTDTLGAIQQQRAALLNNRLYKSAQEAVEDVRKGLVYLKRFDRDTTRSKIDVDIRDQIDDLLSRFDLRANPNNDPTRAMVNLENWVEAQRAAGMAPSVNPDLFRPDYRTPYREMTVESFRGLVDTIKSMEHVGRERTKITIEGEKHDLNDFVNNEIVPKLQERGQQFTTEQIHTRIEDRGSSYIRETLDTAASMLRSVHAQLTGQQFKANAYDRHDILGPITRSVFEPIFNANYRKVDMLKNLSDDFRAKVQELGTKWQKSLIEMLPNDKLIDDLATKESGQPTYMKLTRGKLISIATHVGNESNFDKLTKGYNWEPAKVWQMLNEHMRPEDWKAVQAVWDGYEKHWPDMVSMYRRLGQTIPDKIEPRPFKTPFGEMPGGYAAIKYDPLRSRKGERDAAVETIDPARGLFGRDYFSRSATTNGSMNARNDGYTDAIDLNFHTIERNMHDSIHDLAYREALIDANKVLEHSAFRREFKKAYGNEEYRALQEWLGRIANSENSDRAAGALGRVLQYTRSGLVMNAIALRVSTVLKHGGSAGIKTIGYFTGGGEKYFASRMASMGTNYRAQMEEGLRLIPELRARALQQDRDYRATASSLFEPEKLRTRAERFGHAAVAWADLFTAVPTGLAAYDRAITEGIPVRQGGTGKPMTQAQAVQYASKIIREAHGSNIESARSNIMTAPSEGLRMLTTIYGFMNNNYGQMADSISKYRTPGMGKPEILARAFMSLIVPAMWAELLNDGIPKGEEWAHFVGKAITGEVAASVPLVRDAYSMAQDFRGAGVVGAESWATAMVHGGQAVYKLTQGEVSKGKPISAVADMLGMGLHIPGLGQIGKSMQNIADMESGNATRPDTVPDYLYSVMMKPKKPHF